MSGVGILEPFALADGVVGEYGESIAREGGCDGVIGGLTRGSVAGGDNYGRKFLYSRGRR